MIKAKKWVASRKQYAVRLDSMRKHSSGDWPVFDAVWFRRNKGELAACIGTLALHDLGRSRIFAAAQPVNGIWSLEVVRAVLERAKDGAYGGDTRTRVRRAVYGTAVSTWTSSADFELVTADRALLLSMLDKPGALPSGYDGWWEFEKRTRIGLGEKGTSS